MTISHPKVTFLLFVIILGLLFIYCAVKNETFVKILQQTKNKKQYQ